MPDPAVRRLDRKLGAITAGRYTPGDFVIADAKDADMAFGLTSAGPARAAGPARTAGSGRYRTRGDFLDDMRALVAQGELDIMLTSAANGERLARDGSLGDMTLAVRGNDSTDIWNSRGGRYPALPSRPFRTADLSAVRPFCDLVLYSMTFNNELDHDLATLEAYGSFRRAQRPLFLKVAYNGPDALAELAGYDPSLVVGILGGSAGTTRDTFELLHQAERHGARVALFGRKIQHAESQLDLVGLMRPVLRGELSPADAVRAYHDALAKAEIAPHRDLEADLEVTDPVLRAG